MKTKNMKRLLCLSSVALLSVAVLQGCSDSDGDVTPSAGSAGTAAGAAGKAESEGGAAGSVVAEGGAGGTTAGSAGEVGETAGAGGEAGASFSTQAVLCAKFCDDEVEVCTGANEQYINTADCLTACIVFARGMVGDTDGDTLDCRIYHLGVASTSADLAVTHCPHIGATPTAFCID